MLGDSRAFVLTAQVVPVTPAQRVLSLVFGLMLVGALGACADRHYPIGEIPSGEGPPGGMGGAVVRDDGGAAGGASGLGGATGAGGALVPGTSPVACPIPGTPMPERPLGISLELLADQLSRYLHGHRANESFVRSLMSVAPQTNRDVQAFVRNLLSGGGSEYLVSQLVLRWLKLDITPAAIDPTVREQYTATTWNSIGQEPYAFLRHVLWDGSSDHSLHTLLTAPYSLIDDQLAAIYGVQAQPGQVTNLGSRRSGILTQPALLTSRPRATARGNWVTDVFLCRGSAEPPPTPDFRPLPYDGMTYRQSLEQATSGCGGGCHALADDLGFTLEHFDALGVWRDTDNGLPVDSSASLALDPGRAPFAAKGAAALGRALVGSCSVQQCVVQRFLELAVGGELRASERSSLDELARAFVQSGLDLRELLVLTVGSEAFLNP